MKLTIEDIIDKHKGGKCIVAAQGPSLNPYIDKLKGFKNDNYTIISCNSWNDYYPDCPPDYWVLANTIENCTSKIDVVNQHKITLIYADTVDLTSQDWLEGKIEADFLPYDQRHFGGKNCVNCYGSAGCERYFNPKRLTIQEQLQNYTGFDKHYSPASTVALHMVAFSVLMGFSEIYIVGLDFNYRLGYAKNISGTQVPDLTHFETYGESILNDMQIIADSAKKKGIKIYNLNKDSHWKIFEYKDL